MYFYTAYSLNICSDFEIPELSLWLEGVQEQADLFVTEGDISEDKKDGLLQAGPFLFADEQTLQLTVPDIARFLIQSGKKITYQRLGNSDFDDVRAFLLGSCIGAILVQRGFFVLHGCTVKVGEGCIVCVGHSTAGKSTLAAAFMHRGYSILSDDVCAVSPQCHAIPGIPRVKLNRDVADLLQIDVSNLKSIRAKCDNKFSVLIEDSFSPVPLPILAIYELKVGRRDHAIESVVDRFKRFALLNRNIYRPRYVKAMDKKAESFQRCSELAETSYMAEIERPNYDPKVRFSAIELTEIILKDLNAQGLI